MKHDGDALGSRRLKWLGAVCGLCGLQAVQLDAQDLSFSDPANVIAPPAGAVGQAVRTADLDVSPGFQKPPAGFGVVPFFWWLGDPLTKERLSWELEQMKGMGVAGYQINYAHSDKGGRSYGLTMPSDPALFSEDWWKLTGWFMQEAKKQGAGISLSDYTLGIGQGWCVDEMLREHPDVVGSVLQLVTGDAPADALVVTKVTGADGKPQSVAVRAAKVPFSIDPMNPISGPEYAKHFFGKFEDHFPGSGGNGLNFFFSDELGFGVSGNLWTARFADEFKKRKGYDIVPELAALFMDIGPRTPKVRLDYSDVKVALTEDGFFKPVFDWHQQRGMTMGCDHGGRGRDVTEFGDYFRTQRWNQGPGADQPGLGKDLIKAKVASSIAHLYQRPRVWLEGWYGSGWGTTSSGAVDACFADFVMGYNLLSFHGMYYATHGGWWEWAPPDNTFRMPYWKHMRGFMDCVQRLSYLLTQGYHRCDVAILYPVAPMEAGMGGKEAVNAAFGTGAQLYAKSIDFDFMDFESLARAKVVGKELHVSGEVYRVLVLPAMKALRHSTLLKALEFRRAGGVVLAVGALPEASDRIGRDDPEVAAMVRELFPDGLVTDVAASVPGRDYEGPGYIQHRKLGPRDLYSVYNAPKDTVCFFRATGKVELWDPWTGTTRPLAVTEQTAAGTKLKLPLTESEIQLIVFSPGQPQFEMPPAAGTLRPAIVLDGGWEFELKPSCDNRFGDFRWPAYNGMIAAEMRQVKYAEETTPSPGWQDPKLDDSTWGHVTYSYGPKFWKLGPLPESADVSLLESQLASLRRVDPAVPVEVGGRKYHWMPYEFSWRFGMENDVAHQGYHGLKEQVADDFIGLGSVSSGMPSYKRGNEAGGTRYYLWTAVISGGITQPRVLTGGLRPTAVWLNNLRVEKIPESVKLADGANPVLLRYDTIGRGYFVFDRAKAAATEEGIAGVAVFSDAASWIWCPGNKDGTIDRYFRKKIEIAKMPLKARIRITCDDAYTLFVNGKEIGSGTNWQSVQQYDLAKALVAGANVIAIKAHNGGGAMGLIAEYVAGEQRVGTDATWLSTKDEVKGWQGMAFNATDWQQAEKIANFPESLWAKHPNGPPKLDEPGGAADAGQPIFKPNELAMRWYNKDEVLKFDTRPGEKQPSGWYRFVSPPGLKGLTITARGKVAVWVDGKQLAAKIGKAAYPGDASESAVTYRVEIERPAAVPVHVALRIEQARGCYGGAALPEPILLDCGVGRIPLGDWSKIDGLASYSGGGWYRKTVALTKEQADGRVTIDLGSVAASAEVRVNGKLAGVKVSPPWKVDISGLVRSGDNKVEVLVYNTLANHYSTVPTMYRGSPVSGLIGPVRLEFR
ncbi:MAG: glycosyl hydrolase [Verrucomicrobiota bacterium]